MTITDAVRRAKQGEEQAFNQIFQDYRARVRNRCLMMTHDQDLAEDLTQETFLQVFRKINQFRGDAQFSTWIFRVATNVSLMHLRRHKYTTVSLDVPELGEDFDVQTRDLALDGVVDRCTLKQAICKLPPGQEVIFRLKYINGFDHREIAQLLHCSIGNSKSQLHKAACKVRRSLRMRRMQA